MIDKAEFDWKKYLIECLESTNFCALATIDPKNGVWANPVYFAWDNEFNFYFISQMPSRHMQNIKNDPKVSMAIYKTEQNGGVLGTYVEGEALIVTDQQEEIKHAHEVYYGRAGHGPDVQGYLNNPTWLYVKVIPKQISYFDTRFFDEERQEVPMDKLK